MKKQITISFLVIVSITFGFSCRSKTVVKKLVNNSEPKKTETKKIDGVMYNLPKTMVQVTIPVNKVTKTPGEFADFAPCFFSAGELENLISEPSVQFSIGQPNFSSRGVPDTSEVYVIKTKGKYLESKSLFVEYAPGYVLQKGEAESKNETLEFTAKAIATAAGIAARIVPLALVEQDEANRKVALEALSKENVCLNLILRKIQAEKIKKQTALGAKNMKLNTPDDTPELRAEIRTLQEEITKLDANEAAFNGAITEASGDVTQQLESVKPRPTPNPKETRGQKRIRENIEQQQQQQQQQQNRIVNPNEVRTRYQTAAALHKRLSELITQRDGSLDKNQPAPSDTFKQMVEANTKAIEAHQAAFLGAPSKETWSATLEFDPKKDLPVDYSPLLFSYSKTKGICNSGELKAKSIAIAGAFRFAEKDKSCEKTTETKIQTLWLKVRKNTDQADYLNNVRAGNAEAEKDDKSRGWYYRVPANAIVTLERKELDCRGLNGENNTCLIDSFEIDEPNNPNMIKYSFLYAAIQPQPMAIISDQFAYNEMLIAQLGEVVSVPASTAGRSSVTSIMLDPATGAMKNFKVSSSPLVDKAIIDDAQKAANSTIDAADPLNRKKRELEELKMQNDINEQKKKLANSNTSSNP